MEVPKGILVSTRTKASRGSRGRTRLAVRYFDDTILLTDTHAWAYYRLPSVSYEFTTPEEREALATNITVALAAIRMQDAEVHLRIAHRTYPAAEWALKLDRTTCLIGLADRDPIVFKSARNLKGVDVAPAQDFNAYRVLRPKRLVLTRAALGIFLFALTTLLLAAIYVIYWIL